MTSPAKSQFKRWLTAPPRAHGQILKDRTVSNLELFYDLAYVAVIAQASHHLAEHVSLQGFLEFAVIFGMVWFAWFNGSLYVELHGREDGRTRLLVFLQMGLLALLAVFTAEAAGSTGQQFALVYAAFLALMGWAWYSVRELDRTESPEFLRQSRDIVEAWSRAGLDCEYLEVAGTDHFSVVDELAQPGSALFARVTTLARRAASG